MAFIIFNEQHITNLTNNLFCLDEEAQEEPREAADERVHGLVAAGAAEDHRPEPGRPQRGDLQEPGQGVAGALRGGEAALHRRGGAAETAAPEGVPRLQV